MPVYNTGEILRRTIESVINQTYKDWILYLVDDGSKDKSGEVCDEYSRKDNRIKVYHKQNGGISDARNFAMELVETEYLTFCDHDDDYLPELLEKSINALDQHPECCYVAFRYETESDSGRRWITPDINETIPTVHKPSEDFLWMYEKEMLHTVWSKVFRTSFIKENSLRFDTVFKYGGEDINFNLNIARLNPSTLYIPDILYKHYVRSSLSTSGKLHIENFPIFIKQIMDYNLVIKDLNIDVSTSTLYYSLSYSKLLHLYVSYLPLVNKTYKEKIALCRAYGKEDLSEGFPSLNSISKLFKVSKKNALVFLLHKLNAYNTLYYLFNKKR